MCCRHFNDVLHGSSIFVASLGCFNQDFVGIQAARPSMKRPPWVDDVYLFEDFIGLSVIHSISTIYVLIFLCSSFDYVYQSLTSRNNMNKRQIPWIDLREKLQETPISKYKKTWFPVDFPRNHSIQKYDEITIFAYHRNGSRAWYWIYIMIVLGALYWCFIIAQRD